MCKKYKLPFHIKKYVQTELYDYKKNKKIINTLNDNTQTRTFLLALQRINKIDKVYNSLPKEEQDAINKIFFEKHSQVYAEMNDNITKDMYYNIKNKMIYLIALEFDLI